MSCLFCRRTPRAVLLCLALCSFQLSLAADWLFRNGKSDYAIVLPSGASVSERTAAYELRDILRQVSGASLPVVERPSDTRIRQIHIGWSEELDTKRPADEDEGFTYKTLGADLYIYGGRERGTMYGVYAFLEEEFGVHWLTGKCTVVPKKGEYALRKLQRNDRPTFARRLDFCYEALRDDAWVAHNRLNTQYVYRSGKHGILNAYWGIHTFGRLIPADKYYESHPEYFSLYKGKRSDKAQLCLSNKAMRLELVRNLKQFVHDNPGRWCYDVSQNDNSLPCECSDCAKLVRKYGGQSGAMIWFVNQVAKEVKKDYPDILIGTFAYRYTRQAPTSSIKPAKNVLVRLCDIECCMAHPLDECPENKSFVKDMEDWKKKTKNIFIWDYTTGFMNYLLPFPNFHVLASNYQYFHANHVLGLLEEGAHNAPWSEFSELKQWLVAKLMWNPRQDVDSLMNVFIEGYYGKAAPYVRQYVSLCQKQVTDKTHYTIKIDWKSNLYGDDYVNEGIKVLQQAANASRQDAEQRRRVQRLQAQLYYLKLRRSPAKGVADGTKQRLVDILHSDSTIVSEQGRDIDTLLKEMGYY